MTKRERRTLLIECGSFVLVDTVAENLGNAELSMTVIRRRAERAQPDANDYAVE